MTGPVYAVAAIASGSNGNLGCCCDGRAICAILVAGSAVGAVAGLVTGIISDIQVLNGRAHDPVNNWWQPFETNTSSTGHW
ncbi:MAG: hypothetical protein KDC98_04425 [Planctomycetes bacterium]|nr:hypothetical protein [Planctomycetota bacterium]